jgi:uncharacterized membrane protein YfcA
VIAVTFILIAAIVVAAAFVQAAIGVGTLAPAFNPDRNAFIAAGAVTGITETATGIGGPPLALVYQHHAAASLRANVAVCFFIGKLFSLALLAANGKLTLWQVEAAALLVPGLAPGGLCSRIVHSRLDQKLLRVFVLGFAIVSGLVLIVHR